LAARAASWPRSFDLDVLFARADWRISPMHLLSGRWNRQRFTGGNLEAAGQQNSLEHTGASLASTDTLAVTLTSSFSSSAANSFLFAYVNSRERGFANSPNPEANVFEAGPLVLTIGHNGGSPRAIRIDRLQFSDTVSLVRGRHALKFGGEVLPNWISFFNAQNFFGSFRFSSLESFGRSLAAAPPALPDQRRYTQAFSGDASHGTRAHPDFTEYGAFLQDEWRLHPRLTLNLGLRYDLQVIRKPNVRNPSPELEAAGLDTSELRTDANNLSPRLGLAWSPLRSDRLVLRAGYGIFFARTPSIITSRAHFLNGVTVVTRTISGGTPDAAFIPSYPNSLCGPPDPSGISPNCMAPAAGSNSTVLEFFAPGHAQPYTQQGSFGLEFQAKEKWLVGASYLVVKGTHLQRVRDVNLSTPTTPTSIGIAGTLNTVTFERFTLPRPIAGFGRILLFENDASSVYHALLLRLERRFSTGFQLSAAYTFSKTIDDNPEPIAVNPGPSDGLLLSDATNARADRGSSVNDQRHRFVLSGLWQIPSPHSDSRAARAFLRGWELSGIFTVQTGLPYSAMVSSDLSNDGNSSNDRTPGVGRNTFFLPRSISLDPRITKNIPLNKRVCLQLLVEGFNVLNHGNITAVRTTQFAVTTSPAACGIAVAPCLVPQDAGLTAFGTPTSTSGSRIMQLSAKLVF
ncbi:MAG: TonB-dependent receptor domain-containing protein, partial [Terriglobales bacterium]